MTVDNKGSDVQAAAINENLIKSGYEQFGYRYELVMDMSPLWL